MGSPYVPSPGLWSARGKTAAKNAFPATSLYFWNGDERHDAGWCCSACLSWMNVETAELVTLAEAFIETLQDKTEASQMNS